MCSLWSLVLKEAGSILTPVGTPSPDSAHLIITRCNRGDCVLRLSECRTSIPCVVEATRRSAALLRGPRRPNQAPSSLPSATPTTCSMRSRPSRPAVTRRGHGRKQRLARRAEPAYRGCGPGSGVAVTGVHFATRPCHAVTNDGFPPASERVMTEESQGFWTRVRARLSRTVRPIHWLGLLRIVLVLGGLFALIDGLRIADDAEAATPLLITGIALLALVLILLRPDISEIRATYGEAGLLVRTAAALGGVQATAENPEQVFPLVKRATAPRPQSPSVITERSP